MFIRDVVETCMAAGSEVKEREVREREVRERVVRERVVREREVREESRHGVGRDEHCCGIEDLGWAKDRGKREFGRDGVELGRDGVELGWRSEHTEMDKMYLFVMF